MKKIILFGLFIQSKVLWAETPDLLPNWRFLLYKKYLSEERLKDSFHYIFPEYKNLCLIKVLEHKQYRLTLCRQSALYVSKILSTTLIESKNTQPLLLDCFGCGDNEDLNDYMVGTVADFLLSRIDYLNSELYYLNGNRQLVDITVQRPIWICVKNSRNIHYCWHYQAYRYHRYYPYPFNRHLFPSYYQQSALEIY